MGKIVTEGYIIPVPLNDAIKQYSDQELIEVICQTEHRLKRNKYDVNEAAMCFYDTAKTEWIRRYGKKPVPKIVSPVEFIFEGEINDPFSY